MTDQEMLALCTEIAAAQSAYYDASEKHEAACEAERVAADAMHNASIKLSVARRKLDIALGYRT